MEQIIENFGKQFDWQPKIENADKLLVCQKIVVGGMGGSHLAADILSLLKPEMDLRVHSDYGLPKTNFSEKTLFVACSYSGDTEETFDFAKIALEKGFSVATITSGGKLLEFSKKNNLPHIILPTDKIPPRMATGYLFVALVTLLQDKEILKDFSFNQKNLKQKGEDLAKKLSGKIPVIYSSASNRALSYNWKIKFNETAKIPSFSNVFPELNHNEMESFNKKTNESFSFVFLSDSSDSPKIQKRMSITKEIYEKNGYPVTEIALEGKNSLQKIFNSTVLADWTAFFLAKLSGMNPEKVETIEEFKKQI